MAKYEVNFFTADDGDLVFILNIDGGTRTTLLNNILLQEWEQSGHFNVDDEDWEDIVWNFLQGIFKDRLGNIGFYHPAFKGARLTRRATRTQREGYPYFNIKFDGGFRVCEGPQNTAEFPGLNQDLREKCMTIEDYIYKLSFLVKYTIKYQGFPMTSEELYSKEPYKEMILRKIEEKPSVMKGISVPPSLNNTAAGRTTSILQRFNFGKGNL